MTARPFRLAAIDIDDTLVGPDGRVSPENAAAVHEMRRCGVQVVLASGRSHANMLPFHRALGLGDGPVISAQGALVADAEPPRAVWQATPLPSDVVAEVTRDGLARGHGVAQYRASAVYLQARTRWTDYDESRGVDPQRLVPDLAALDDAADPVLKVMWLDDPDRIAAVVPQATARYAGRAVVTPTDLPYLEFAAPEATKAVALAAVADRLGVPRDRVLAFGDGNNDAPMLAWAGLGVAMDHARPAALDAAALVAPAGDPETALARAVAAVLDR
jgi:Cof subfamily protein (haloacid dehalogenase superfamily)